MNIKDNSLEKYSLSGTDNEKIVNDFIAGGCTVTYNKSDFTSKWV